MRLLLLLTCLTTFGNTFAQVPDLNAIQFGKIDPQHFELDSLEDYPEACAVVLADLGKLSFVQTDRAYMFELKHHIRIKILKDECSDVADFTLPFYSLNGFENIEDVKAMTFTSQGHQFHLSSDQIFREAITEGVSAIKFSMPQAKAGSIIDITYKRRSKNVTELEDWLFQSEYPTLISALECEFPIWASYQYYWQIPLRMTPSQVEGCRQFLTNGKQSLIETVDKKFICQNLPPVPDEPYMTTREDYVISLKFQLSEILIGGVVQKHIKDWGSLYKEIQTSDYIGKHFAGAKKFKKYYSELEDSFDDSGSQVDLAKSVYNAVKNRIRWNEYYDMRLDNPKDVFEKGIGSSGDINLILIGALNEAGLNATPALLSTYHHGKVFKNIPFLEQFNHIVIRVNLDGEDYYLDASNPYLEFGKISMDALGKTALLIGEKDYEWITLPSGQYVQIFGYDLHVLEDGSIGGKVKCQYQDYSAIINNYINKVKTGEEAWTEILEDKYSSVTVDSFSQNDEGIDKFRYAETFNVNLSGNVQSIGTFSYVSPFIYSQFKENPLQSKERYFPMDLKLPYVEKQIITLEIPEGYTVDQIPEPASYSMPDNSAMFNYSCTRMNQQIQISTHLEIKKTQFSQSLYSFLRQMFITAENKMSEQIVLKKE